MYVSMLSNLGDITGGGCPERRSRGVIEQDQDSRRSGWCGAAVSAGLSIWTTMPDLYSGSRSGRQRFTTWQGGSRSAYQLDYILGELPSCSAWGSAEPTFRSDHRVMWAVHVSQCSERRRRQGPHQPTNRERSLKGWAPHDEDKLHRFRCTTEAGLRELAADIRTTIDKKLEAAEKAITTMAPECGKPKSAPMMRKPTCPRALRLMESQAARPDTPTDEKNELRKAVRQLRRQWQSEVATWRLTDKLGESKKAQIQMKDGKGVMSADPRCWTESLRDHCAAKCSLPPDSMNQANPLAELDAATSRATGVPPEWSWDVTLRARAALTRGKSTGRSAISSETLLSLSSEALWTLHAMLKAHFETAGASPMSWTRIRLFLLPKSSRPEDWSGFRGICLVNVLSKLFVSCLMVMLRVWSSEHLGRSWHSIPLFGFEQECKAEDLLTCLQARVAEAAEWPEQRPVVVASSDVRQAFDYVTPEVVARCMTYWGFPEQLTRSLIRESVGSAAEAVCVGIPPTGEFPMQGCVRQGGVESPWCFNRVIRTIYAEKREQLEALGLATPLLKTTPMLGWADNLIFLGDTLAATQRIIDEFSEQGYTHWKPSAVEHVRVGATTTTDTTATMHRRGTRRRTTAGDDEEVGDLDDPGDDDDNLEEGPEADRHDSTQRDVSGLCWADSEGRRHLTPGTSQREFDANFWM